MRLLPLFSLLFFLSFCSTPPKQGETAAETQQSSEDTLTYMQLYDLVIQDTGERIEWHGEEIDQSAAGFLSINENGRCGENDCGKALALNNSGADQIHVVIQAPFQIEDVSSHLATKYTIAGNSTISIGCSHLCYAGEAHLFERRIVGAKTGEQPF
ncbi:MAG: hypothetical protein ABJG78_08245 [Cyclobacteriaceae bacterium]